MSLKGMQWDRRIMKVQPTEDTTYADNWDRIFGKKKEETCPISNQPTEHESPQEASSTHPES